MIKFYDTNAILKNYKSITEKIVLSSTTLIELEDIKSSGRKDEYTKYRARKAVRFLKSHPNMYDTVIVDKEVLNQIEQFNLKDTPDNEICASAYLYKIKNNRDDLVFVTDDICCSNIASKIFELKTEYSFSKEEVYKGYRELTGNTDTINSYMENTSDWLTNEYLIVEDKSTNKITEMRYDGSKFVNLILPERDFIKAKNSQQRCALDILMNPDINIVSILGGYGSGKTFLSMMMAVYNVTRSGKQSKILGVREPAGEGRDIGYLPGSMEEKTDKFFEPLIQQLDGGIDQYNSLKEKGVIEVNIPYYMKGTTYNYTVILVDEAEDLSEKQLKLIGTRVGEGSKIIFAGDYKQSLMNATCDNPLLKMCNEFKGSKNFGCIYLGEDVRSEASKMFASLFEGNDR